jgi:hypothetical protein
VSTVRAERDLAIRSLIGSSIYDIGAVLGLDRGGRTSRRPGSGRGAGRRPRPAGGGDRGFRAVLVSGARIACTEGGRFVAGCPPIWRGC